MKMDISQACFNTTLIGVIRGIADYMNIDLTTPELYGRSGHAFFLNIHGAICPSGPYCWNIDPFILLLENCGIRMNKLGFYSADSSQEDKNALENIIRKELEKGNPCSILNMEHQLIIGVDDSGFVCTQPWKMDFPSAHLAFGSWEEIKDEIHACFYSFEKIEVAGSISSFVKAMQFVKDLNVNPQNYTVSPYTAGISAYDVWISGIKKGYGKEHGNWWNGTVWSECRKQAAIYFDEMSAELPEYSEILLKLKMLFNEVSDILLKVGNKELEDTKKIDLLVKATRLEINSLQLVDELILFIS